jgi:hypothetical protein
MDLVLGPVLLADDHLTGLGIDSVACKSSDLAQTGQAPVVDWSLCSVQPELVFSKFFACGDSGQSMKILLQDRSNQRQQRPPVRADCTWSSVTLTEEFIGVFNLVSFFPQYLMTATVRQEEGWERKDERRREVEREMEIGRG